MHTQVHSLAYKHAHTHVPRHTNMDKCAHTHTKIKEKKKTYALLPFFLHAGWNVDVMTHICTLDIE